MSTRGAIERAEDGQVTGWISSRSRSLRDVSIQAFLENDCIGAGKVNVFRQDIADVGLGDGYAGFVITVSLPDAARQNKVYVKLEGDDVILVGANFHSDVPHGRAPLTPEQLNQQLQSIRWLRDRNCLSQTEADILRTLARFGVYETRIGDDDAGASLLERANALLRNILALALQRAVQVEQVFCPDNEALVAALEERRGQAGTGYIGLWSAGKNRLAVAEGSHVAALGQRPVRHADGVEYDFGDTHMLVLDPRATLLINRPVSQVLLLTATP